VSESGSGLPGGGLFGGLFGRGGAAVDDRAWLQAMLDTEAALARALERAGLVSAGAGAAVSALAVAGRFDANEIGRQATLTGNPVPALVRELSAAVPPGGFARDFGTADGKRVMVAALTQQQFADLAMTTRLARTFAFLGRLLLADFSAIDDLHTHRDTIAVLLAPWFSRRTVADLAAAFAGTSVPWACLHNLAGRPGP